MKRLSIIVPLILAVILAFTAQAGWKPNSDETIINLYGHLTHRTMLRSGTLPRLPESLTSRILSSTNEARSFIAEEYLANTNDTVTLIADEFHRLGVVVIPWGQSFALLLSEKESNATIRALADIRALPHDFNSTNTYAGTINFSGVDLNSVLQFYGYFRNRTILRPTNLPSPPIYLRSETSMTKEEAACAIAALFIINGLAIVDDGEKMVQIVPRGRLPMVKANAPKTDNQIAAIDPKSVPLNKSFAPNTPDLATYYGTLTGRKYFQTNNVGDRLVLFTPRTPLTTNEMVYAIRKAFALNDLVIVDGPENSFTLVSPNGVIATTRPAGSKPAKPKQK